MNSDRKTTGEARLSPLPVPGPRTVYLIIFITHIIFLCAVHAMCDVLYAKPADLLQVHFSVLEELRLGRGTRHSDPLDGGIGKESAW